MNTKLDKIENTPLQVRSFLVGQLGLLFSNKVNFIFSALFLISSLYLVHPAEDAVILFEYAKTLADTGVISYGGANTPIEGATDFLWMSIISLLSFLGLSENTSALLLSSIAMLKMLNAFHYRSHSKIVGLLAICLLPFLSYILLV